MSNDPALSHKTTVGSRQGVREKQLQLLRTGADVAGCFASRRLLPTPSCLRHPPRPVLA